MTQNELNKIIENHQHYLNKDIDGWENMRADLSYQDLSGLDLKNANLRNANLYKANLRKADLCRADFRNANLRNANLYKADLRESNLYRAFCCYVNLCRADLRNADFRETNLLGADLREADLRGAKLQNAYMEDVKISEDTKIAYPIACPETGSFIGYKKAAYEKIVKLQICEDAKRSSAITKKCRCSKALVLAIENMDGSDSRLHGITSIYDPSFIYRVGEIAEVSDFDDNRWRECAPGIHFFMDRQDAVKYRF